MTPREPELDRLTTLLGQCLGRIDEQAYRLQRTGEEDEDFEACDALEREAAMLQELVSSVVSHAGRSESADINRIVDHGLRSCISELEIPIVIRQNLTEGLPRIDCAPGQLAFAVQRALMLALGSIEAGGEIRVITRLDQEAVLLEIESPAPQDASHLDERATTLSDFVISFRGTCRVDTHGRSCLIAMELPVSLVADG